MSTLYETRTIAASSSGFSCTICPSSNNLAIHPLIWAEYKVKLVGDQWHLYWCREFNDGLQNKSLVGGELGWLGIRQGYPVARSFSNVALRINNKTTINHYPRPYLDALTRLYMTEEEIKSNTTGGAFDSGSFDMRIPGYECQQMITLDTTQAIIRIEACSLDWPVNSANNFVDHYLSMPGPINDRTNVGLAVRCSKTYANLQFNSPPLDFIFDPMNDNNPNIHFPNANDSYITICEPLCIDPLYFFPKFSSAMPIHYIKHLHMNVSIAAPEFVHHIVNTNGVLPPGHSARLEEVKLHIRYVPPPENISVPPVLFSHGIQQIPFKINVDSSQHHQRGTQNIRFTDIPPSADKLYFYCAHSDIKTYLPTEHFLGLDSITLESANVRQTISSRHLYDLWREEGVNKSMRFEDWRLTKAVCVLSKKEFQIGHCLNIQINWINAWRSEPLHVGPDQVDPDGEHIYMATLIASVPIEYQL